MLDAIIFNFENPLFFSPSSRFGGLVPHALVPVQRPLPRLPGLARLAGLGVAGGANVAAGYGACARDEPLEVHLAAAHGVVGATFDPDHYGVAVARAKDGSLTISGNRAAVEAALSGNALGRVLQDLS